MHLCLKYQNPILPCNIKSHVVTLFMFKKEADLLKEISEKLSADDTISKAIAYGSRIRGDFRSDSDLDIIVIVDKKDRGVRDKILDIFYSYELERDISFSIAIFSLEEWEFNERLGSPLIENIKREGMVFHDTEYRREKDALKISS